MSNGTTFPARPSGLNPRLASSKLDWISLRLAEMTGMSLLVVRSTFWMPSKVEFGCTAGSSALAVTQSK